MNVSNADVILQLYILSCLCWPF